MAERLPLVGVDERNARLRQVDARRDSSASRLRVPVVDKDRLREGALLTLGTGDIDQAPFGPELFYATIEGAGRRPASVSSAT